MVQCTVKLKYPYYFFMYNAGKDYLLKLMYLYFNLLHACNRKTHQNIFMYSELMLIMFSFYKSKI